MVQLICLLKNLHDDQEAAIRTDVEQKNQVVQNRESNALRLYIILFLI